MFLFILITGVMSMEVGETLTGHVVSEDSGGLTECCYYTSEGVEKACYAVGNSGCRYCSDLC